jgi:hypothetical protein
MKQVLTFVSVIALFIMANTANATTYTVSNNANRPAQFTDLQIAIDSASAGDTLLITGSTTDYGSATLYKPLVLIGESHNIASGYARTYISYLYLNRLNSSLSASGSSIQGIYLDYVYINGDFSGSTAGQESMTNIQFDRCDFYYLGLNDNSGTISNVVVKNSLFRYYLQIAEASLSNVLFQNCVFNGSYIYGAGTGTGAAQYYNGNLVIRNCLFLNKTDYTFYNFSGGVIENCIFYKAEPRGSQGASNSTFNNNLTYLNNNNVIPYTTNVGSGNIVNANPNFSNYPQLGGAWATTHNYSLLAGSPAIGTGTNGTDIGLKGGVLPVSNIPLTPKNPAVTSLVIPQTSVPVGGTLQIQIQATTRQ